MPESATTQVGLLQVAIALVEKLAAEGIEVHSVTAGGRHVSLHPTPDGAAALAADVLALRSYQELSGTTATWFGMVGPVHVSVLASLPEAVIS